MQFSISPIGFVSSSRKERKDINWDVESTYIELTPDFAGSSLAGLDQFSHATVIFLMDRIAPTDIVLDCRHPRDREDLPKVGIFAQRSSGRPNRLGATVCRVLEVTGRRLYVAGLDAIDGSPVIDIKPWMIEFGPRGTVFQPPWVSEIMRDYWRS